ncbi:unnamed protein product [Victoria cruziana]
MAAEMVWRGKAAAMAVIILCLLAFNGVADGISDVCKVVISYGYDCSDNQVTTEDGYVLGLQRIASRTTGEKKRPPVLLQHGFLVDGMVWVLTKQGLALALSDAGFDAWIVHTRGTKSSRRHTSLDADTDQRYWAWTWVEFAEFDIPATIDFIHNATGQRVHLVGHSLGALTILASISQHKLVDKAGAVALLAPVVYMRHVASPLLIYGANLHADKLLGSLVGAEFLPHSGAVDFVLKTLCSFGLMNCSDILSVLTGTNCCIDSAVVESLLTYEPQSTSTRAVMHIAQMVRSGKISKYDYGNASTNDQIYGQSTPPVYDLSSLPADVPLFISRGGADALTDVKDFNSLVSSLGNQPQRMLTFHPLPEYAHADFVMGSNAGEKLHRPLISFLSNSTI